VLPYFRLWRREHVEAYKHGRRWTADENVAQRDSLRGLYLTLDEVSEATGLTRNQLQDRRKDVPRPAVGGGRMLLWLRSEVGAFVAENKGSASV
jgi:predicted DNA-binding transcriptional regulator AlpA